MVGVDILMISNSNPSSNIFGWLSKESKTVMKFGITPEFVMSSYICDELLEEIFKRLPSKTLLQLRSLSKSWCSRISSPDFILTQTTLQTARNYQNILIQHRTSSFQNFFTVHYQSMLNSQYGNYGTRPMKSPNGYIVGSCNGIICLRDHYSGNFSLWNPSIRRKLTLPYPFFSLNNYEIAGVGFDSKTDDYKIVILSCFRHGKHKSMVYSLKKPVWREITPPSSRITCVNSPGCVVNGVLHWVVRSDVFQDFILTFDLSSDVFSEMTLPEKPNQYTKQHPIIFNGSLGMLVSTKDCYHRVWAMKEYNNVTSWYMTLNFGDHPYEGIHAVLQLKNGNLLIRNHNLVMNFHPNGELCSVVCMPEYSTLSIVGMVMYVESLALLDIGTVCNTEQIVLSHETTKW
ncbi:F-box/kelch-repeat protein At3g23880-like [Rutidosis leptorrhynchoides]|uniref:F-box/kelch-repeat protein At3g23880-like n=1 Tax=Rutidosis leptorrhynchoides TaxID=125765 RepID=UPI003A98F6B4